MVPMIIETCLIHQSQAPFKEPYDTLLKDRKLIVVAVVLTSFFKRNPGLDSGSRACVASAHSRRYSRTSLGGPQIKRFRVGL